MAKKKKQIKKKQKAGLGFKGFIFAVTGIAMLVLFLPTTFLLAVGLLPTFVAAVVDREPGKNKTFTVGAMNLAGCFPFLVEIWTRTNSMDAVMALISDPATIVVMYGAAGAGYLLNWVVSMVVSAILIQKSRARIAKIKEEKTALEVRWGKKVNGSVQLDEYGFPIEDSLEIE